MPHEPFHLKYTLSRSQRLVPHVRMWGAWTTAYVTLLFTFFVAQAVVSACTFSFSDVAVFGGLALGVFVLFHGLLAGLADALIVPVRRVDVVFEENAAGVLLGTDRWYLFLDGVVGLRKYRRDVWTVEHFNGSVLHIPESATTEEQLQHIRAAMERGRTPEGVRAVIERGRRIAALRRSADRA